MTVVKEVLKFLLAAILIVLSAIATYFFIIQPQGLPGGQLLITSGTCFVYLAAALSTAWALGKFKL
jgi:hypothetical protein